MSTSTRAAKATYHPGGYGVSEGLKRARAPFFTANLITGSLITAFAASVYFYSIRAVAQDDFSDLDQPVDEDLRRSVRSIEDEKRAKEALVAERLSVVGGPASSAAAVGVVEAVNPVEALPLAPSRSGIAGLVQGAFGGKGADSKIVWGAPNVDRIGRIGEEVPVQAISRRLV
jgi:cytochrome c oxidase assembly factor 3